MAEVNEVTEILKSMTFGIDTKVMKRSTEEAYFILKKFESLVETNLKKVEKILKDELKNIGDKKVIESVAQQIEVVQGNAKSEIDVKAVYEHLTGNDRQPDFFRIASITEKALKEITGGEQLALTHKKLIGYNAPSLKIKEIG